MFFFILISLIAVIALIALDSSYLIYVLSWQALKEYYSSRHRTPNKNMCGGHRVHLKSKNANAGKFAFDRLLNRITLLHSFSS